MDWSRIERDWSAYRNVAKVRWDRLSEKELLQINGRYDELCAKIQQAYGVSRNEAELQVADWAEQQTERASDDAERSAQTQDQSQTLH